MPATFRPGKRPSKYRAIRTEYAGVSYASKAEAAYAAQLDLALRAGQIRGWTRQVAFALGCPENRYIVDFVFWRNDGTADAVDVKGMETPAFKKNKRLWAAYGPCGLLIVRNGKVVEAIEGKAKA